MSESVPIIDAHVHMRSLEQEDAMLAIREATGADRMGLVAIQDPAKASGLPEALAMKHRHPETFFVFAGLNHAARLYDVEAPSLVEQMSAFAAAGCDGIKMIEGKPTARQEMNVPVTDPYYAAYWERVEAAGTAIVWHVNDPEEFWDPQRLPAWARERRWGYGPDDVQKEAVYGEVDRVLERHPALNVIFAHFYFLSADLPRAAHFLDAHPSVAFDLAPGIEMLYNISKNPGAGRDFFMKYADRIVYGTDLMSDMSLPEACARAGIVRRWLETEDTFRVPAEADFLLGPPEDGLIRGLGLPGPVLEKIFGANFIRRVGHEPGRLNGEAAAALCGNLDRIAQAIGATDDEQTPAARVAGMMTSRDRASGSASG